MTRSLQVSEADVAGWHFLFVGKWK